MSFRSRLVLASSMVTTLTLSGAFAAVSLAVVRSQRHHLDAALVAEAHQEASEASALEGKELAILEGGGPYASDVGPLTKYGAIYAADGSVRDATATFRCGVPPRATLVTAANVPFDLTCGAESLRGVIVALPAHPGAILLLATPRTDLEANAAFLRRAMTIALVVAIIWSLIVTTWIVRSLTRDHQAIAEISRRVSGGDLRARVRVLSRDHEMAQLAGDINDMIERLETLVDSQRHFIAHAAHELRGPLTTLYGELSHALRRRRDAKDYREAIEEALDATRRLNLLANDLLALARIAADRDEADVLSIRLREVVSAGAQAAREATSGPDVMLQVDADDASLEGRPLDLQRLVRNLVENAIQHSPPGGLVRVEAIAHEDDVEIVVSDEGTGVPKEDRELIFEPFHRAANDRAARADGVGLGLAIVREIARSHGGEVRLDDRTAGTRFIARIPRHVERRSA
jgi:two-component system heavy metal sensor histidine kinase CusS